MIWTLLLWKFRKGCLEFRVALVCAMCTTCTVYILQLEGVVQFPQGGVYATKYTQSVVSSRGKTTVDFPVYCFTRM